MAKIQLVDNWRSAWRWYSVRAAAAIVSAAAFWTQLPDATKEAIPDKYKPLAIIAGGIVVMAARVIQQKAPDVKGSGEGTDGSDGKPGL